MDVRRDLKQKRREKSKDGWEKICNNIVFIVHDNTGNQKKHAGETRVIPFKLTATAKLLVWVFT